MGVPTAFLPLATENAELAKNRQIDSQLLTYARDARAVDRGRRLTQHYSQYPWLSPGIATAYTKWEEQMGTGAARDLARAAYTSATSPGATDRTVNRDLLSFMAHKDFQEQVARHQVHQITSGQSSWWDNVRDNVSSLADYVPVVGSVKALAQGNIGEAFARAIPGQKLVSDIAGAAADAAGQLPVGGNIIKGIARTALTAAESPYQEIQGAAVDAVTGLVGPVGDQAQPLPENSRAGRLGAATRTPEWQPYSTGGIALQHLASGQPVDLGTGIMPGGEVQAEHVARLQDIATYTYGHVPVLDHDGQPITNPDGTPKTEPARHFVTPGRFFAAQVFEPGTNPYNALSGTIDAAAILTTDPVNLGLAKLGEARLASKGFAAPAAETLAASDSAIRSAGGFKSWIRNFVHPPTAVQYLDSNAGLKLTDELAYNYGPKRFAELARRTNWEWPAQTYVDVTTTSDPAAVRASLLDAFGTTIDAQPNLHSFGASIRNVSGQRAALSEIPGVRVNIDADSLSGPYGSLKSLYNHALGIGLDDAQISRHLYDFSASLGPVQRANGLIKYMDMEKAALVNMGLPDAAAHRLTRFASEEMSGRGARYFEEQIASGADIPGVILDGASFPLDKPYTLAEHLGNTIYLPPLLGPEGRNAVIAKYGRVFGLAARGFAQEGIGEAGQSLQALSDDTLRHISSALSRSNTALIGFQNRVWKPFALLRGAWMIRVLGEEQIRMTMAGYDSIFNHPIRYFSWLAARDRGDTTDLLDWASKQGGLRNTMQGSFGLTDPSDSSYGRIVGRITDTFTPEQSEQHAKAWADKLIQQHNDPLIQRIARDIHAGNAPDGVNPVDVIKDEFSGGALDGFRKDLSTDPNFLSHGIDLNTRDGADTYIDGLYDRLKYYTNNDPELIASVATGHYAPNLREIGNVRSLKGLTVTYDGTEGEVVAHSSGSHTAHVLFPDMGEPVPVSTRDLTVPGQRILTNTRDDIHVDKSFINHLASRDTKPETVSGIHDVRTQDHRNHFVDFMFAKLMDEPTSKYNRSQVFTQEYVNQMEQRLPWMDDAGRQKALAEVHDMLQGGNAVSRRVLRARWEQFSDAAARVTAPGELTHDEAQFISKAKSLDKVRDLLYDSHRKNRTLAAMQLIAPFGEAWKEMWGSWARIIAERPQTVRKFQMAVNAARGANPFDMIPGAIPGAYQGRGFFYKDPSRDGADTFIYPWTGAITDKLIGVPIPQSAQAQSLSIGFNLVPGVGPAFQAPAMFFLDRYLNQPQWDPIRHLVAPYGSHGLSNDFLESTFAPAWLKKFIVAGTGDPKSNDQSGRALNSIVGDILNYRASTGEADIYSPEGLRAAYTSAEKDARWLYLMQGTFQFGLPAAPHNEFLAQTKNGNLVRFSMLRDELHRLYLKDPDTAVAKFVDRFGERAMFVTAPKSSGTVFGQEYTKRAYNWQRTHTDIVTDYPTTFGEFSPRRASDKFNYDAYAAAVDNSERTPIPADDAANRTSAILGTMYYDQWLANHGVGKDDTIPTRLRPAAADVRQRIHADYPGFRRVATDDTRLPIAIDELVQAAADPRIRSANPRLYRDLSLYVAKRQRALDFVTANGGVNDFNSPGFSSAAKWQGVRDSLRAYAEQLGTRNAQFLALWEDTFSREMKDDESGR